MDHLLINESSFSAANLSSYSLADIWPLKEEASNNCGLGLGVVSLGGSENGGRSVEASTVTEQNSRGRKRKEVTVDVEEEDGSSRMGSATGGNNSVRPFLAPSSVYRVGTVPAKTTDRWGLGPIQRLIRPWTVP